MDTISNLAPPNRLIVSPHKFCQEAGIGLITVWRWRTTRREGAAMVLWLFDFSDAAALRRCVHRASPKFLTGVLAGPGAAQHHIAAVARAFWPRRSAGSAGGDAGFVDEARACSSEA
jgi:hypothetical protein